MTPRPAPEWLSVNEFAAKFGLSRREVYKWVQIGGILATMRVKRRRDRHSANVLRIFNEVPPHFDDRGARIVPPR